MPGPAGRGLPAHSAYDLVADAYDAWNWQTFWRRNERPLVERALSTMGPVDRALDIGSGTGGYLSALQTIARETVALDISRRMLARARRRAEAHFVVADASRLPFADHSFDVAIAARVLSHVRDASRFLAEAARVLAPGGPLLLTDVHPAHGYDLVRIATPNEEISIETHKHGEDDLDRWAFEAGFVQEGASTFGFHDLEWSPPAGFTSIDRSGRLPIFVFRLLRLQRDRGG